MDELDDDPVDEALDELAEDTLDDEANVELEPIELLDMLLAVEARVVEVLLTVLLLLLLLLLLCVVVAEPLSTIADEVNRKKLVPLIVTVMV